MWLIGFECGREQIANDRKTQAQMISMLLDTNKGTKDFPGGSDGKVSAYNAEDPGSIPGLGRSPGEGNGNPLQYSCLENPMGRGAWQAIVHGVAKSRTRLSDFTSNKGIIDLKKKFWGGWKSIAMPQYRQIMETIFQDIINCYEIIFVCQKETCHFTHKVLILSQREFILPLGSHLIQ